MIFVNFSRLANDSAPLFARYLTRYGAGKFRPLSPITLVAMLQQLELPGRRSKLQLSGIQHGCSMLLCDEAQQCQ